MSDLTEFRRDRTWQARLDRMRAEISDLKAHLTQVEQVLRREHIYGEEARRLITEAEDLMTVDQLAQWRGVRAWLETYSQEGDLQYSQFVDDHFWE